MIKKILLLFCCVCLFLPVAVSANYVEDDRIFIDPDVAEQVIRKYFGNYDVGLLGINLDDGFYRYGAGQFVAEKLQDVLNVWNRCVKEDKDRLVSVNCVVDVCREFFGGSIPSDWGTINDHCKQFVGELIETRATGQSGDCIYSIKKVNNSQMRIQYLADDGTGFIRSGGYLAWRFFNPGNLRRSSLACGRIETKPNGTFAVFDSYERGRRAMRVLLRSDSYNDLTIRQAITKYAPPSENNTTGYIAKVNKAISELSRSDVDVDTIKLRDLTDSELVIVMDVIESVEGWYGEGEVISIN